uniref:L1 transposable element RRM domain-containing protein n=1 Tax=Molossus molossus TaxID=27622 RepID=A0A7J8JVR9_MOLMO|nr:hypothetical protein HJG59_007893 [Molossus molossus]
MIENFPNLVKEGGIQFQEAQRAPSKKNPNRPTPRHIVIKMPKINDKERILKAAREKQQVTYKGNPIRLSADFSTETLQARREWHEVIKVMKNKNLNPKLLYPSKAIIQNRRSNKELPRHKKAKGIY